MPSRRDGSTRSSCCAALVREPSTLGNERGVQELVAAELRAIGLEPALWDVDPDVPGASPPLMPYAGRPNVTATRPGTGGGRSLTFNGHIDVVPATPEHHWTHDPWGAEIADGAACTAAARRNEGGRRRDARRGPRAAADAASPATSTSRP